MRIALVLRQKKQDEISQAVVFDVEKDKVVGVENETIHPEDVKSLSSWAETKKVKEIYLPNVEEWVKNLFTKMGITMKAYDELSEDKLFQTFIL